MANKRSKALAQKLKDLDQQLSKNEISLDEWQQSQRTLLQKNSDLNMVSVNVADGEALYVEIKRGKRAVTFEWLYGGPDGYVDDWGKIISIPVGVANRMIRRSHR